MILGKTRESKSKKDNIVGRFLQFHMLGIMTRLADVINDSAAVNPQTLEQRTCIQTLEELIKVCKSYTRVARPQACSSIVQCHH